MDVHPQLESSKQYTIAWIAALAHELAAATAVLDEEHERPSKFEQQKQDTNVYTWGRIGKHNVVIASLPAGEYGLTIAATTANSLRFSLPHIRFGLMVGIGAGIPQLESGEDVRLGDVVVSQPTGPSGGVVQYDLVKAKAGGHFLTGHLAMPPESLRKALSKLQAAHDRVGSAIPSNLVEMLNRFPNMKKNTKKNPGYAHQGVQNDRLYKPLTPEPGIGFQGPEEIRREDRGSTDPEIHYGVIASGNTLVKSAREREEILKRLPEDVRDECLCIEMEAAGLMNTFPCMVIRGICDYADENKNDLWQKYAAATAAAFAKEYLQYVDPEEVRRGPELGELLIETSQWKTLPWSKR
jgi:nucleoside phosphorylase